MQHFSAINIHKVFSKADLMPLDKESVSFQEIPLFERLDSRWRVNMSNPGVPALLTQSFFPQVSGLEEWHCFHYHTATWPQQELMCAQPGPAMSVAVQTEQVSTGTMSLSLTSDRLGLWRPYTTQLHKSH